MTLGYALYFAVKISHLPAAVRNDIREYSTCTFRHIFRILLLVITQFKGSLNRTLLLLALVFALTGSKAQQTRIERVGAMYDSLLAYDIAYPKIVLAQAMFETGWMECKKCTFRYNNLFGFRGRGNYMRFATISDCLEYLKTWQQKFYEPWRQKHPKGTYYEFLTHMKYAADMPTYLKKIKWVERWVDKNVLMGIDN